MQLSFSFSSSPLFSVHDGLCASVYCGLSFSYHHQEFEGPREICSTCWHKYYSFKSTGRRFLDTPQFAEAKTAKAEGPVLRKEESRSQEAEAAKAEGSLLRRKEPRSQEEGCGGEAATEDVEASQRQVLPKPWKKVKLSLVTSATSNANTKKDVCCEKVLNRQLTLLRRKQPEPIGNRDKDHQDDLWYRQLTLDDERDKQQREDERVSRQREDERDRKQREVDRDKRQKEHELSLRELDVIFEFEIKHRQQHREAGRVKSNDGDDFDPSSSSSPASFSSFLPSSSSPFALSPSSSLPYSPSSLSLSASLSLSLPALVFV
jgi:hypothetical protein